MQLKEFINSRVETVQTDDTVQRAAEKMRELDVGSLPVCEGSQLVGMITDRDITIRAVARERPRSDDGTRSYDTRGFVLLRKRRSRRRRSGHARKSGAANNGAQ